MSATTTIVARAGDVIYVGRDQHHAHWGYWEREVRRVTMSDCVEAYRVDRDSTEEMIALSINPTAETYEVGADGTEFPYAVAW